jgi:hypothetical protein
MDKKYILDSNDINTKVTSIFNIIELLDKNIEKIHQKISDIRKIYMRFEFNKNLPFKKTNSYLKFQIDLLINEKKYFKNIKNNILEKISKDIYDVAEYSLLVLLSIDDIDIGKNIEKIQIIKKIIKIRKSNTHESDKIITLIHSTLNNLNLINDFINLIDDYTNEIIINHKNNNIHSNNFKITLKYKQNSIISEYVKYTSQIKELIDYFYNLTNSINSQINNQDILKFIVNKK